MRRRARQAWIVAVLVALVPASALGQAPHAEPPPAETSLAEIPLADPRLADPSTRPPLSTGSGPALEEEAPVRVRRFDGNHTGLLLGAGPAWLGDAVPGVERQGTTLRLGGRVAFIMQLLDLEVGLQHGWHGATPGGDGALTRTDLDLQVATHPAFPLLVFNSWLWDVVAGLHGYAAASLGRISLDGAAAVAAADGKGTHLTEWRPSLVLGAGADIPVSPRDRDWGLWLTVRYGLRWTTLGDRQPAFRVDDEQVLVLLGWRTYSTYWARLPRPF